jgi:Protein of unknown function (DUF3631)
MPTRSEPHPNPIDALESYFKRYLAIRPGLPLVLALWSAATYLFDAFDAFAYLAITSPTKRCGKTRASELIGLVSARPLSTVGISAAALYRVVEKEKPTLIIDEAESLRVRSERSTALREILNAGYRKGQRVIRCGPSERNFKPEGFDTYGPKVLVLIRDLPDTLADRCIPIKMTRRTHEAIERFRFGRVQLETAPLRRQLARWAKRNREAVARRFAASDVPFLVDREAELWLPLFVVCDLAAPHRRPDLETVARSLAESKSAEEPADFGIKVLADIRQVFDDRAADRLATSTILSELNCTEESPWPGWSHGHGLDARGLSALLRPFGIHPQNVRLDSGVVKGYHPDSFQEAWKSYLAPSTRYTSTEPVNTGRNEDLPSATEEACSGRQN